MTVPVSFRVREWPRLPTLPSRSTAIAFPRGITSWPGRSSEGCITNIDWIWHVTSEQILEVAE